MAFEFVVDLNKSGTNDSMGGSGNNMGHLIHRINLDDERKDTEPSLSLKQCAFVSAPDLREWLVDSGIDYEIYDPDPNSCKVGIRFHNSDDAIKFKLSWDGYEEEN